jgi:hypothetical protein
MIRLSPPKAPRATFNEVDFDQVLAFSFGLDVKPSLSDQQSARPVSPAERNNWQLADHCGGPGHSAIDVPGERLDRLMEPCAEDVAISGAEFRSAAVTPQTSFRRPKAPPWSSIHGTHTPAGGAPLAGALVLGAAIIVAVAPGGAVPPGGRGGNAYNRRIEGAAGDEIEDRSHLFPRHSSSRHLYTSTPYAIP